MVTVGGFANDDDELAGASSPEYGNVGAAAYGRAEGDRPLECTWRFERHDGHERHWAASGVQGRGAAVRRVEGQAVRVPPSFHTAGHGVDFVGRKPGEHDRRGAHRGGLPEARTRR